MGRLEVKPPVNPALRSQARNTYSAEKEIEQELIYVHIVLDVCVKRLEKKSRSRV